MNWIWFIAKIGTSRVKRFPQSRRKRSGRILADEKNKSEN